MSDTVYRALDTAPLRQAAGGDPVIRLKARLDWIWAGALVVTGLVVLFNT